MFRWLGLWRLVLGRVRSDHAFLFALWLLIVSATTLLAAGALYAETVEVGGLRRALAEAPPTERGVSVRVVGSPAEMEQLDGSLRPVLESAFRLSGAETRLTARSSTLRPVRDNTQPAEPGRPQLLVLGAYEGIEEHATLVDGGWPEAGHQPLQAAISEGAAAALDAQLGSRLALADASRPGADPTAVVVEVEIAGIYAPQAQDSYWLGDSLDLNGVESGGLGLFGPLMVGREDLTAGGRIEQVDLRWRALPLVDRMRVDQLERTRAALGGLPSAVERALPAGRFVTVDRGLADVLGRIDRSALVSRGGVVLITLQFGVLAGYAVLLVGGILAERRRSEVALLRARGASTAEVGLIAAGEATVLSLPAALLAPWLALGLVNVVGGWGPVGESGIITAAAISPLTLPAAALAGLACLAALTLPALLTEVDLARVRAALGRPLGQTLAQRLGLDLVLLAVAIIGVVQLRTYGATVTQTTSGRLDLDPLLVAAPAISLAAGAVLVVRLVPRLGELAERLLRRRRGLLLSLGTRQVARRPLRYTRSALLIVLAAALGTFGSMYGATWSQSQVDQAGHQAAADVRVLLAPQGGTRGEATADALRQMEGVTALSPVVREQFDVGRAVRRAALLAVQPDTLAAVLEGGPAGQQLEQVLGTLSEGRGTSAAIELPAGSRRLAVVVTSDLQQSGGPPGPVPLVPEEWLGIGVVPIVGRGAEPAVRLEAQAAYFAGPAQRLTFSLEGLDGSSASGPPVVRGVELSLQTWTDVVGEIRLDAMQASQSLSGDADWLTVARPGEPGELSDWSMEFESRRSVTAEMSDREGRLVFDREHPLHSDFEVDSLARWAPASGEIVLTAFASEGLLSGAGIGVGESLDIDYQFQPVSLMIAARLSDFPSLDPATPFVIIDAASLDALRFELQLEAAEPDEWWLAADDGKLDDIAAAARAEPIRAQEVITRSDLTRTLLRDPIALGLVGALLLGSLAAAAFAVVGLLVNAVVSAREQLGELALLRALGASGRHVLGWLTIEHGFVLAVGLLAGAGVGYVIGLLVLPHTPLNRSGAQVVPSPQIVLPADLLALVAVAGLAVVVLGVAAARREIGRRPVIDVLRESED